MSTVEPAQITIAELLDSLTALKQKSFTGQLFIKRADGLVWVLYFYLGRLIYATGGRHSVRRWRRHLYYFCPQFDPATLKQGLERVSGVGGSWEYELICQWADQKSLTGEQAIQVIRGIVSEVFFDLQRVAQAAFQIKQGTGFSPSSALVVIDPVQLATEQQQQLQQWREANLINRSPNLAPVIVQPEALQQKASAAIYETLTKLLAGKQTIRDIAFRMKRTPLEVLSSLMGYIQSGTINLIEIEDLAGPTSSQVRQRTQSLVPLVACVDDSEWVCQMMEKLVSSLGYRFLAIQDPLRALTALLANKPQLMFLDLRMPNTNGYELCGQLRKVSFFETTPIVILTGNDGFIDRVRAKVVGATDFLSKSVENEVILETIKHYLNPDSPNSNLIRSEL
jgi:chemotaxis family two-component system response regulator PixG